MEKNLVKIASFGLTVSVGLLYFATRLIWMRGAIFWLLMLPLAFLFRRYMPIVKQPGFWLFGCLSLFVTASNFWGEAGSALAFADACKNLLQVTLFLTALYALASYRDYRIQLAWSFFAFSIPSILYSIVHFYSNHAFTERIWGWTGYNFPTEVGSECAMGALAGIVLIFLEKSKMKRALIFLGICVLIAGILFSQTRAALFALALSCSIMALHYKWGRNVALFLSGASVVIFTLLASGVIPFRNETFGARWQLWQHLIATTSNPLIGVGSNVEVEYQALNLWHYHAHNIFVSAYYKTGLIGLFLLVALVVGGFKLGYNQYRRNPGILNMYPLCWFVMSVIICLTDYGDLIWRPTMVWFLIWMPYALLLVDWEQLRRPEQNTKRII